MRDPLIGTDHTAYEKEVISRWLQDHSQSPTTREPMQMN